MRLREILIKLKRNGFYILLVGVLVAATLALVSINKNIKKQSAEINRLNQRVDEFGVRIGVLDRMPLAWAETAAGLKLVPADLGVSKEDLEFLKRFRGPLLDLKTEVAALNPGELRSVLRSRLINEFEKDSRNLALGETRRQALITFAVLRVNGSMPTYAVRTSVPNNLDSIVLGTAGNCSDFTIRMMMVGEALGLKVALISAVVPTLPGHVFVDAYDPESDTGYMLDANFNVIAIRADTKGKGFFESLLESSVNERKQFASNAMIKTMPVYTRFVDPGVGGIYETRLDADLINSNSKNRETTWRHFMSDDAPALIEWWKKAASHRPRTLAELKKELLILTTIPPEFSGSGNYAIKLRLIAGVL